ncbi:dipeptide/oligopeptide/nickel ABC transporter permease/ATP-binding protein (plasmid) [Agrobacterium tumefaciens]|uniref:dipeptide/oligopeptide/nickel ABC transporter permease/ATP-binding protein n=1 Tax=Agrobacterium tumefaciens TaxID=358 RepID=UPI001F23E9D4|nr:dipeptide/oligopeptide/nickel ABC transporter permease/ATP-binding protein [Agrobacterium tumefaciens]WQE43521.1 dipeptide/oligopeptide/nickel ABC transporter permease/ATP-binding protein [Agrobacterium tumefaciens]
MTQKVKFLGFMPKNMIFPTVLLLLIMVTPFLAQVITDADPVKISVRERMALPSIEHLLGQDEFGRDRLARVLYGGQVSLTVAFVSTTIAAIVGILFGLVGAYFRGIFEFLAGRLADIVLCFPPILLALLVVTLFGPGVMTLVAVLSILYFPVFARIVYSEALRVSAMEFVEASRALGTSSGRILFRTILPNISGPIAIQFSLTVAAAITIESGLSFLGLGVVPPAPSWGQMIRGARGFMEQDPLGIFIPCLALTITILAINLFCDRLRDVLDPKGLAKGRRRKKHKVADVKDLVVGSSSGVVAAVGDLKLVIDGGDRGAIPLIQGVSLELEEGTCTALVGESGSGKSLSSLALMGLLPDVIEQTSGSLTLRTKNGTLLSLNDANERTMESVRGSEIAMIFQDPMTALNPVRKVGQQVVEAIQAHSRISRRDAEAKALRLLQLVGINEPERRFNGYPHQMSGGMRQRVMISMALTCEPRLLIADEPTTALDVTIQAEIIDLLRKLRREYASGLSMLFISHNLGIVSEIADRVAVMYSGQIVEDGPAEDILFRPKHPYTKALIASMPSSHDDLHSSRGDRLQMIGGAPPLPYARPSGCSFRDRCPYAAKECSKIEPPLIRFSNEGRNVRCLRLEEIEA